jgi:hypothetical protein
MMSGMNSVNDHRLRDLGFEDAHRRGGEHFADEAAPPASRRASAPSPERRSMYGSSSASEPPMRWISRVAVRLGHVEHVVDGHDADQHPGGVGDRQRAAVVLAEHGHGGVLIVGGRSG